jgi:hypothetical protein
LKKNVSGIKNPLFYTSFQKGAELACKANGEKLAKKKKRFWEKICWPLLDATVMHLFFFNRLRIALILIGTLCRQFQRIFFNP